MLVMLVASTVSLFGQLREQPDLSLVGVRGIRVIVNYQGPGENAYGLSQQQLQDAAESRLNADHVTVLKEEDWTKEPGRPLLYINIAGTQVGTGMPRAFLYSFAADLIQQVSLSRSPSLQTEGSTWNQDYAVVVEKDRLLDVSLKISDLADDFAQALREANK